MGVNNLHTVAANDPRTPEDINQFSSALKGDIVPRDAAGAPRASGADLGSSTLPFATVHADEVLIGGAPISSTPSGTTQLSQTSVRNGVLSGKAPAERPDMCGWLLQAGANGVKLVADADDPLRVKLDGVQYDLTESITGGTPLPANYSNTVPFYMGDASADTEILLRNETAYAGLLGVFFSDTDDADHPVPETEGDVFIAKLDMIASDHDEYVLLTRRKQYDDGRPGVGYGVRGALNTSATDYTARHGGTLVALADGTQREIIRTGYVFVDPTTATWTLAIEKRIVGAAHHNLPSTGNTGEMLFRETDQRWYRYSGTQWVQTSRVYLGICAIESGVVVGVQGVRSETGLNRLAALASAVGQNLVTSIETEGSAQVVRCADSVALEAESEAKGLSQLIGQAHVQQRTRIDVPVSDLTLEAEHLVCLYYDANDHSVIDELDLPPEYVFRPDADGTPDVILAHPSRNALFIGSVSVGSTTSLLVGTAIEWAVAAYDGSTNRFSEPNDTGITAPNFTGVLSSARYFMGSVYSPFAVAPLEVFVDYLSAGQSFFAIAGLRASFGLYFANAGADRRQFTRGYWITGSGQNVSNTGAYGDRSQLPLNRWRGIYGNPTYDEDSSVSDLGGAMLALPSLPAQLSIYNSSDLLAVARKYLVACRTNTRILAKQLLRLAHGEAIDPR